MATPDRWAPWIEPFVGMSVASQAFTTTTWTDVTGVTVTFTPHVNSRLAVSVMARALGNPNANLERFALRLVLDGNPVASAIWGGIDGAGEAHSVAFCGIANLVKEATSTLKLQARCDAVVGAPTFTLFRATYNDPDDRATGLAIVAAPSIHAP